MKKCTEFLENTRFGDNFKYISFPVHDINRDFKVSSDIVNKNKLLCNLIRAKTNVKELAMCNNFNYFFTLTCNNKKCNRYNLSEFRTFITGRIKYIRKKYGLNFDYLLIPEQHKKGGWHLHGLIKSNLSKYITINKNGYDTLEFFNDIGFNSIEEINNKDRISSYITKYITKDFAEREKGKHLYFASQNLNRPVLLKEEVYNNVYFDNMFFPIKNDFCFLNYSKFDFKVDLK